MIESARQMKITILPLTLIYDLDLEGAGCQRAFPDSCDPGLHIHVRVLLVANILSF